MPALLEYVRDEPLPDRDEILARLGSHDRDVVLRILTLMCPCRNACYDVGIWSQLPPIWQSQWDFEVREAARHAVSTLRERARIDGRSRELLDRLADAMGDGVYGSATVRRQLRHVPIDHVRSPKAVQRDVPTLIELLASNDDRAIADAIAALCPRDGRRPSKKVWQAILDMAGSPDEALRRQAVVASAALDAHAATCERRHE
ncbi:MAG TPA: hypothetical protein VGK15_06015 [Candidatus Limnocylindria bacterium]|jgi:hypothetical protein